MFDHKILTNELLSFCWQINLYLPGVLTAIVVTTSLLGSLGSKGSEYPLQTSNTTVWPVPMDLNTLTISLCVKPKTQMSLT